MASLKTIKGESKTSIKHRDTYTSVQFVIGDLQECLIPDSDEVHFYVNTGERNAKTIHIGGSVVRSDEGIVRMNFTDESFQKVTPGMYSVECHIIFPDGRYLVAPSNTPFYLTVNPSLSVEEEEEI